LAEIDIEIIIEKVRQGDKAAFGKIYDEYVRMVASVLRKIARCPQSEMDYHLNEVFFRVYKGVFLFKGKSKFSTYVYRIALNYSFQASKKMRKEAARTAELDENTPSDKLHFEDTVVDTMAMEKILDKLTIKLRAVVVLYYYDSLSIKEISEVEKMSETAVKNRLFQARNKIKEIMVEEGYV
jgi:RNA polymerase sigma-70 factor, ECF subfamily